jgi:hypothetical protein
VSITLCITTGLTKTNVTFKQTTDVYSRDVKKFGNEDLIRIGKHTAVLERLCNSHGYRTYVGVTFLVPGVFRVTSAGRGRKRRRMKQRN